MAATNYDSGKVIACPETEQHLHGSHILHHQLGEENKLMQDCLHNSPDHTPVLLTW